MILKASRAGRNLGAMSRTASPTMTEQVQAQRVDTLDRQLARTRAALRGPSTSLELTPGSASLQEALPEESVGGPARRGGRH